MPLKIELNLYLCAIEYSIIFRVALFAHCMWKTSRDAGIVPARISLLLIQQTGFELLVYARP